jgi:hypothetical protein
MVNGAIQNIIAKELANDQKIRDKKTKFKFLTIISLLFYKIRLGLNLDIKQWA